MYLKGNKKDSSRVGVGVWTKDEIPNKKGKFSTSFSIEDANIDEVVDIIRKAIEQHCD